MAKNLTGAPADDGSEGSKERGRTTVNWSAQDVTDRQEAIRRRTTKNLGKAPAAKPKTSIRPTLRIEPSDKISVKIRSAVQDMPPLAHAYEGETQTTDLSKIPAARVVRPASRGLEAKRAADDLIGERYLDRFKIIKHIGSGGFGMVFLAVDENIVLPSDEQQGENDDHDNLVVLKFTREDIIAAERKNTSPERAPIGSQSRKEAEINMRNILAEGLLGMRLRDVPGIVRTDDILRFKAEEGHPDIYVLRMEWCPEGSLYEFIEDAKQIGTHASIEVDNRFGDVFDKLTSAQRDWTARPDSAEKRVTLEKIKKAEVELKSKRQAEVDKMVKHETSLWTRGAAAMMYDLTRALDGMHDMNLIHGDIKPQNVFLKVRQGKKRGDANYLQAKLADMGTSKGVYRHRDEHQEESGFLSGTLAYMPLSSIDGRKTTAFTDVYALAVTFFELMTGGEMPYEPFDYGKQAGSDDPYRFRIDQLTNGRPDLSALETVPEEFAPVANIIGKILWDEDLNEPVTVKELLAEVEKVHNALVLGVRTAHRRTVKNLWSREVPVPEAQDGLRKGTFQEEGGIKGGDLVVVPTTLEKFLRRFSALLPK